MASEIVGIAMVVRREYDPDNAEHRSQVQDAEGSWNRKFLFREAREYIKKHLGIEVEERYMEIEDPGDLPDVFVLWSPEEIK